jgi:hypothetical protein
MGLGSGAGVHGLRCRGTQSPSSIEVCLTDPDNRPMSPSPTLDDNNATIYIYLQFSKKIKFAQ